MPHPLTFALSRRLSHRPSRPAPSPLRRPARWTVVVSVVAGALCAVPVVAQDSDTSACARCIASCAKESYPSEERPSRPPDDVHHENKNLRIQFQDARAQDPAFGGRNLDGAIAGYRGAVRQDGDNAEYRNYLAAALMRRGNIDEARYNLKKAVAINPAEAKYVLNLGYAHHKAGDEVRAMAAYLQALALDPGNLKARLFAGHAFRALGMKEEAAIEYRRLLALDPDHDGAKRGLHGL